LGGLVLSFGNFRGSARELKEALRSGRIRPEALPLSELLAQALAQAEGWPLLERARLAPELAALVLLWLGAAESPEESPEAEAERTVAALVDLEAAASELAERAEARRDVIPLPPAPLPDRSRLAAADVRRLARLAPPARPRPVLAAIAGFGLREAWRRIRALLAGRPRLSFDELAPRRFGPRAIHLAALLEAARRGWVALFQPEPYGPIEVERRAEGGELTETV